MSQTIGGIGTALAALQGAVLGSRSRLQPASFRGVPFLVDVAEGIGGRRLAVHEFPLRDVPYLKDLGRLLRTFRLTAYVIDPLPGALSAFLPQLNISASGVSLDQAPTGDWMDQRDALLDAIETYDTAATLVHPTMGQVSCRCSMVRWREHLTEEWGACEFLLEFLVDGPKPSPTAGTDTASSLLAGVASMLPMISAAYETIALAIVSPEALLGQVVSTMFGLPPDTISGLAAVIASIAAQPGNLSATAAAVQSATQGMAANVLASQPVAPTTDDAVVGTPFSAAPPADPSGGLATLASWGSTLPAVTAPGAQAAVLAAQQAALVALVQGCAVAAMAQVYAQTDWPTADAAGTARTQLLGLLDAQTEAAAASGQDDLYRGWRAMTTLAMQDMIQRAQSLPTLAAYVTGMALPAVVLAQLLYQDPTRADQIASLNDSAQPLFMAAAGMALSS